jgi:hypothetical protein
MQIAAYNLDRCIKVSGPMICLLTLRLLGPRWRYRLYGLPRLLQPAPAIARLHDFACGIGQLLGLTPVVHAEQGVLCGSTRIVCCPVRVTRPGVDCRL